MNEKLTKRLLSVLLSLALVIGMMHAATQTAFAASTEYISMAHSSFDSSAHSLILSGEASYNGSQIDLVEYKPSEVAGVFTADKMLMGEDGFSMAAKLSFGYINPGGGGFALVLSKTETACRSSSLGYIGLPNSVAVLNYINYNSNYVSFCQLGQDGIVSGTATELPFRCGDYRYKDVYVWLDYDASSKNLYYYKNIGDSTKPSSPCETYSVDLSGYTDYYIGVTANSGEPTIYYQAISLKELYYDASYHSDSLSLDGTVSYETYLGSVTSTTAELRGNASITGFEYKEGASGSVSSAEATAGAVTLTGLTPDTQYYYRTYTTSAGPSTVYGSWQSFATLKGYTVSVTGGYIGSDPSATSLGVDDGNSIKVTAPSVHGSYFVNWTNDADGSYVSDKSAYTFTVTSDISLTANYITPSVLSGSGTKDDPYQITNEADLNSLSVRIEHNESGYSSAYYELTNDITLSSLFTPIGTQSYPFKGVFEGNHFTISGLQTKIVDHGGLFGYTDGATIKDLAILNATVSAKLSAGGIAGYNKTSKIVLCTVSNSSISANGSTSSSQAGGIAGYSSGEIANCTVSGGSGTTIESTYAAGGIVGQTNYLSYSKSAIVEASKSACDVTGSNYAGGIVGYLSGASVSNCEYSGHVKSTASSYNYAGGIVGRLSNAQNDVDVEIQNCIAFGTLEGVGSYGKAGGIAGYTNNGGSAGSISNCVAMQTQIIAGKVNSLLSDGIDVISTDNYAGSFLILTGSTGGMAGTSIDNTNMNSDFWTNLGFSQVNGWVLQTSGTQTTAVAEAHLVDAVAITLTVDGNAVPTYMGMPLNANSNGTYTVYAGMKIKLSAAAGYRITQLDVNGIAVTSSSWEFIITADSTVSVTTEQAVNGIWVYQGRYVTGAYSETSTYADIDWTGAVYSYGTPLSGTYNNMDLYVLDNNWVYIGQLTLSGGSVVSGPDNNYVSLIGATADSYLRGDSLNSDKDMNLRDLAVEVESITGTGKGGIGILDSNYDNASLTVNGDVKISYLEIDDSSTVRILGDMISNNVSLNNYAVLDVAGTLTSDSYFKLYNNSKATILGDIEIPNGEYGVWMEDDSGLSVSGSVTTSLFFMKDQTTAEVQGNVTVIDPGNVEGGGYVILNNDAALDISGTLSAESGVNICSTNAVLLSAKADSTTPNYNEDTDDPYYRTTLSGLPKNAMMEVETTDGSTSHMKFTVVSDDNGELMVWLRKSGDTVIATALDGAEYAGGSTVSSDNDSIEMSLPAGVIPVTISIDIETELASGTAITYNEVYAVSEDTTYICDVDLVQTYLTNENGKAAGLNDPLSAGHYYLTVSYVDKDGSGNLIAYGIKTYSITVKNQYTISFDSNGGSSVSSITALDGKTITLPSAALSGYALKGWSDGTKTYAAGSSYTVIMNTMLTAVWQEKNNNDHSSGGGSSSGSSSTQEKDTNDFYHIKVGNNRTVVTIDNTKIVSAANNGETLAINAGTTQTGEVLINAEAVNALAGKNVILQVQSNNVNYNLSPSALDMDALARSMGVNGDDRDDIELSIMIKELNDDEVQFVEDAIAQRGYKLILPPVEFTAVATYGSTSKEVSSFNKYVTREIAIPKGIDPREITTAVVVSEDGTERSVPTEIYLGTDGVYYARVYSLTNSVYVLISSSVKFSDTDGTWYGDIASEMASRLIISGRSDGSFDGNASITRAEFSAILVRALGLSTDGTANFTDVSTTAWYYGAVGKAAEYGLITGREDGSFDPNAKITRQEAMVMIQRAAAVADYSGARKSADLSEFNDVVQVGSWAKNAVNFNVSNGLIVGSNNQLRPNDTITRAECAAVVLRLLQNAGLIDIRTKA